VYSGTMLAADIPYSSLLDRLVTNEDRQVEQHSCSVYFSCFYSSVHRRRYYHVIRVDLVENRARGGDAVGATGFVIGALAR
jgi:hypothetical protein